jgi:basic membrane protein A
MLVQELGSETTYVENVPEGPSAESVIRQLARDGYDLIVTTSFGYMDPTINVARQYPEQWFVHIGGYKVAANVSTVYGRMYQPMYLSGIVAGSMTSSNLIGYVASFPIPDFFRDINAFALGARSVNPAAQVRVIWTGTFYDPVTEGYAATALLDAGADVLASSMESMATQQTAKARNKVSIGKTFNMASTVGDTVLTSAVWNWGVKYVEIARRIAEGTYASESYWGDMVDGIVNLAPLSSRVPGSVVSRVQAERVQIISGANKIFVGPIYDSYGSLCVSDGEVMTDAQLLGMMWVVQGVVASDVGGCR